MNFVVPPSPLRRIAMTEPTAIHSICADCRRVIGPYECRLIVGDAIYHAKTCGPSSETARLREQNAKLIAALDQALDDMREDYCVCAETKEMMRAAIAAAEDRHE
jgi:hypothetical protein